MKMDKAASNWYSHINHNWYILASFNESVLKGKFN